MGGRKKLDKSPIFTERKYHHSMQRKKTLKIGSSNFKDFIESNGYFVDKTLLIQEVIDTHYEVLLIPRPRRFGKSINLSMLKSYFDVGAKDTAKLFEPFKIWQTGAYYTERQGKYPVIHVSLKEGKATTFEKSQAHIFSILTKVYREFRWLLQKGVLDEDEVNDYLKITAGTASLSLYVEALSSLSNYLNRYYGEKVLILMDEYDAPIHTGFYHGYYNKIIELMKSLMGSTFKDNDALYKGVITGILRIAKESIFSDLNNPGIFTLLKSSFSDKFGFTKEEVKKLLDYYDLEQDYPQVETWYNGYQFGNKKEIYNPWSIANYIAQHEDGFNTFWVNTSSDDLIKGRIIEKEATDVRTSIEQLLKGEIVEKDINENIIFADFEEDKELLWSLLLFCGYLSPTRQVGAEEALPLRIPNYEIRILFKNIILEWYSKELKVRQTTLRAMVKSLKENRIPDFERYFKKIMGDTFSYFDTNTEPERVYQAYVLGLLGIMGDEYVIKSNKESGLGRYDILLLPRNNNDYGIIIEIKQLKKNASADRIKVELSDALKQITKNKYYKELVAHKVQNRIEMAMVFVGKEVQLKVN